MAFTIPQVSAMRDLPANVQIADVLATCRHSSTSLAPHFLVDDTMTSGMLENARLKSMRIRDLGHVRSEIL
jgi:hypothetical protein